jgi:hypothetical protein
MCGPCYRRGMKILALGAALLLGGCAQQLLTAAQHDCSAFGYSPGTESYAGCVQARFGTRQAMMQHAFQSAGQSMAAPSSGGTAFLRSDYVSGTSRICTYDRMGSPYVMTVSAAQICPVSVP